MAIPNISNQNIIDALMFIDENGVPDKNKSTQYLLITEDGKQYPPKYVIAVANFLANGGEITTEGYNAGEAKNYFKTRGYVVEERQEKFELTITATDVSSSDERFDMDNLGAGDGYKPLEAYFKKADGSIIQRKYNRAERRNSNQTMPRLACQIFENQISALSNFDKEKFPICKYTLNEEPRCGIFSTVEEFRKHINTIEYVTYSRDNGPTFVFYCWNIFSTIIFVQECLKRFGDEGDQFVLTYREKTVQEKKQAVEESACSENSQQVTNGIQNPYSKILLQSKNIIFRGAPGTGKSYLAKSVAADIISDGLYENYSDLSEEQKEQIEFVQFHPSYDYSDFVEGLRPVMNADGSMGFELQDGVFKRFVTRARNNYETSLKTKDVIEKESSAQEILEAFLADAELETKPFTTINGNEFSIIAVNDTHITVSIPNNELVKELKININELRSMLESGLDFEKRSDVTEFFGKKFGTQAHSYDYALFKEIKERGYTASKKNVSVEKLKKYIFIIDEINRGEISKILGELFFSIDPGYRGVEGAVSTQYANLHADPNEKFFIPENVYIIGTMNDIDRSVDSFDFAMRRRFRFLEVTADESSAMLEGALIDEEIRAEACKRMAALNKEIKDVPDLNENYQIGAAYFLKLKDMSFDELWTDCLQPVLQDYVRGMYDEDEIMKKFAKAYKYIAPDEETVNED